MIPPLKFNFDISLPRSTSALDTFQPQRQLGTTRMRVDGGIGGTGAQANGIGGTGIRFANGIGGTGISGGIGGTGIHRVAGGIGGTGAPLALTPSAQLKSAYAVAPLHIHTAATPADLNQRLNELKVVQSAWSQALFKLSFI